MKITAKCAAIFAGLLGALGVIPNALAAWQLNMPEGVSAISREVYGLHMLILWICVAIGVVVFGAIIWSVIYHRKSRGAKAAEFHESTTVEVIWTVIPFIILVAMAIPAAKTLVAMEDTSNADLTIKITGYQWKWRYQYLDEGVDFFSTLATPAQQIANVEPKGENYLLEVDHPLVVPTNKKVRFLITSNDVIHAWWVPDLAVKKDAIPGFINEMWTKIDHEGVYRGQCAELCGKDHGFMPVVVVAKNDADYASWVAAQKGAQAADAEAATQEWTLSALLTRGEQTYQTTCAACHQPDGKGLPGVFPAISGSAVANGPITEHINLVLDGRQGTAMQAFAGQLSDIDLAAVITYQRNALGNAVGDMVQPSAIAAARN